MIRGLLGLALGAGCGQRDAPWDRRDAPRSNVLVIVADDVGTDKIAAYGEHPQPPSTPNIDALASDGLLFRNAWTSPTCSPTRVGLVTGQHPVQWGANLWVSPDETWQLPPRAFTIPELLNLDPQERWSDSFVGKWHLTDLAHGDPANHPLDHGWDWYAGSLGNLDKYIGEHDGKANYREWQKDTNGELAWTQTYATTDTIDDALARMDALESPWVLWVSLNAAHVPFTSPPIALAGPLPEGATDADRLDLVVEAMDRELGRLLDATPGDTTIVFIGDNGTTREGIREPWDLAHGKATLFEGGVNVPLIVAGPLVATPGQESLALVHSLDVFATLGDNAGANPNDLPNPVGGHSLLPLLEDPTLPGAEFLFASKANENGFGAPGFCATVRDVRYKLVRCDSGSEHLYDLRGRHDDGPDLLESGARGEARQHLSALRGALRDWRSEMVSLVD